MFDSILIRPNGSRTHPLDFGQVIENLFFYRQTIVHIGRGEVAKLYQLADVDVLENLLRRKSLTIKFNNSFTGVENKGNIRGVSFYGLSGLDLEKELYQEAYSYGRDETRSRKFAKKISRLIQVHELPHEFQQTLNEQIKDKPFLNAVTEEVLRQNGWAQPNGSFHYELEFLNNEDFRVHTDINLSNPNGFTIDAPLLALINASEDMKVMADASSEVSLPEYNSVFVRLKAKDVLEKSYEVKKEIEVFNHFVFDDSWALREAINSKRLHVKAILKALDKAEKFRGWLNGLENDSNLMREYVKKIEEKTILEELPFRAIRFYMFNGVNAIVAAANPMAAIPVATALSAFDSFLLDRIGAKWKPNQFIEGELRPLVKDISAS